VAFNFPPTTYITISANMWVRSYNW